MSPYEKQRTWLADQPIQRKITKDTRAWSTHTSVVPLTLADTSDDAQARQVAARGFLLNQADSEWAEFDPARRIYQVGNGGARPLSL